MSGTEQLVSLVCFFLYKLFLPFFLYLSLSFSPFLSLSLSFSLCENVLWAAQVDTQEHFCLAFSLSLSISLSLSLSISLSHSLSLPLYLSLPLSPWGQASTCRALSRIPALGVLRPCVMTRHSRSCPTCLQPHTHPLFLRGLPAPKHPTAQPDRPSPNQIALEHE